MFSQRESLSKGLYRFRKGGCFSKSTALTVFDRMASPMFVMQSRTRWNLFSAFFEEIRCPKDVKWRYVSQRGYWDGKKRNIGLYDENWNDVAHFSYHDKNSFPETKPPEFYTISIEIEKKEYHFFQISRCSLIDANIMVRDQQFHRIFHTSIEKKGLFFYESIGAVHVAQEQPFLLMSILIPLALLFQKESASDSLPLHARLESN